MMSEETIAETRRDHFERGLKTLISINGDDAGQDFINDMADISPELGHQVVAWAFGDIYQRPGLTPRDRELLTLGMLTALGGCEPELEAHIMASLNVGLSPQEIVESFLHSAVYCGMPKAINATLVAKKVFMERHLLPVRTMPS
jgi:4-carboxymuconolactone decarboxylase